MSTCRSINRRWRATTTLTLRPTNRNSKSNRISKSISLNRSSRIRARKRLRRFRKSNMWRRVSQWRHRTARHSSWWRRERMRKNWCGLRLIRRWIVGRSMSRSRSRKTDTLTKCCCQTTTCSWRGTGWSSRKTTRKSSNSGATSSSYLTASRTCKQASNEWSGSHWVG